MHRATRKATSVTTTELPFATTDETNGKNDCTSMMLLIDLTFTLSMLEDRGNHL